MRCYDCRSAVTDVRLPCPSCGVRIEPVQMIGLGGPAAVRLFAYGLTLVLIGLVIVVLAGPALSDTITIDPMLIREGLIGFLVCAITIVLHEIVHGLAMRWYGATPRYGVGLAAWFLPYAYATAPGYPFALTQFIVIALAPFVVISAASLTLMWTVPAVFGYAAVAFVTNFSGAVGDLWFVWVTVRFRRCPDLWLVDIADRLAVYTPDRAAAGIAARLEQPSGYLVSAVHLFLWWVGLTGIIFGAIPLVLTVLGWWGVTHVSMGLPGYPFLETTADGFWIDIGPLLATTFLLAVPAFLVGRWVRARARREAIADEAPQSGAPRPAFL